MFHATPNSSIDAGCSQAYTGSIIHQTSLAQPEKPTLLKLGEEMRAKSTVVILYS